MSKRSAKFVSALVASMLAGANLAAVAEDGTNPADTKPADTGTADTKAADNCLSGPKGVAPAGSHWYYRLDRATKRQCWYVRAEGGKAAKAALAQPESPTPAATAQVAAPPPQPQPDMTPSVANARAEFSSPQANVAQIPGLAAPGNGPRATAPQADAPSSPVSSRWLDSSTAGASSNDRLAAADAAPSPQPDAAPASQPAAAAVAPATADTNLNRQASSTQMLLAVMIAALALAGLIGAIVFRFGRRAAPPYDTKGEWRAPWDPLPAEQRASRPIFDSGELPMRRPQAPAPRRTEGVQPPAEPAREEPASGITEQQIAAMLARLGRSAT
jgi:hypothetical protein